MQRFRQITAFSHAVCAVFYRSIQQGRHACHKVLQVNELFAIVDCLTFVVIKKHALQAENRFHYHIIYIVVFSY